MILQYTVLPSWWPLLTRIRVFSTIISLVYFLNYFNIFIFIFCLSLLIFIIYIWIKDIGRESYYIGSINLFIQMRIKLGFVIFIFSEIIFFVSFFWTYFHFIFIGRGEIGFTWPSCNIIKLDFSTLSLFNTILLLSRGYVLTSSHLFLVEKKYFMIQVTLLITIILGVIFICFQILEYYILEFLWSDRSFGSIFYITTGFHGIHVMIGAIFLTIVFFKKSLQFFILFEFAAWYWHFVDVVWLILFTSFYWWPTI